MRCRESSTVTGPPAIDAAASAIPNRSSDPGGAPEVLTAPPALIRSTRRMTSFQLVCSATRRTAAPALKAKSCTVGDSAPRTMSALKAFCDNVVWAKR
ncbi:hypothetical protein [Mycolicibacterium komossense]|uniref:Uncharacterized protein n=1 Tax=Mycolicibacterium komossense TaxID=1779 RepID=A0ABT3CKZ7_9MYCO|nr:hypothetical protein [Mycolicibacterium komossense]MCV7230132.1 hypothetical protein [Mycolicibacterium komossense]